MTGPWIRTPPARDDDARALLVAGALAAGVGLLAFYLTRLVLARERIGEAPPRGQTEHGVGVGAGA